MRFAYHWNDEVTELFQIERDWFRATLRATGPLRNLVIRLGNLTLGSLPGAGPERLDFLAGALGEPLGLWSSFDSDSYQTFLARSSALAMVVSGLTRHEAVDVHHALMRRTPAYVGGIEVDNRIPEQWALFDRLPLRYRVIGDELRLLWPATLGDDAPTGPLEDWTSSRLFAEVTLEDIGVRQSIFDAFDDYTVAERVADTASRAGSRLQRIADEVVDRVFDLDPRLVDALNAALKALDNAQTGEELAHAALSLRRFFALLADVLFPAREAEPGKPKLGKLEYKNRLAAYAEGALNAQRRGSIKTELDNLGSRLSVTVEETNAGLHEMDTNRSRIDRLVTAVLTLTYDLLSLTAPPRQLPTRPHDQHVIKMARELLEDGE